ncbi:MAG: DUF4173 domain-containing protein [Pseudomonadota bacterium]
MTTIPAIDATGRGGSDGATAMGTDTAARPIGRGRATIGLAVLIAFADLLFWGEVIGLSLAIFGIAVFCAAAIGRPLGEISRPAALAGLGALPVLHYVQPLSVVLLIGGLLAGIAWLRLRRSGRVGVIAGQAFAMVLAVPWLGPRDLRLAVRGLGLAAGPGRAGVRALLRAWALPIGGTLVLLTLLTDANPILADWLAGLLDVELDWVETARRTMFWLGVALVLWPMIGTQPAAVTWPRPGIMAVRHLPIGLNTGSVLRALVLFNLVLAIQTGMDATLLWGETGLPEGMSYAEYAHRGAYPLLVTALLAGAFALAARPFLDENRALRPLVFVWLAQNVALCLSSARRLDLYVDAFGLTYLRLYVILWIGVVAVGLCLTAWQIWRRKPNRWLVLRSACLGLGVLYAASFVSFAHIIAERNLRMDPERIDWTYLCRLPDIVDPVIRRSRAFAAAESDWPPMCFHGPDPIDGWRDWSFRRWRAAVTLQSEAPSEGSHENIGGR